MMDKKFLKRALATILPTSVMTLGVMLAVIGCSGGNLTSMAHGDVSQSPQGQRTFAVGTKTRPTIKLRCGAGQMKVRVGASGEVKVEYNVRHSGAGKASNVVFSQDSHANSLSISEQRNGSGSDDIAFSITVPKDTNLDFATSSGSMDVADLVGRTVLSTNAGNIDLKHVVLKDSSSLVTQSGNVNFMGGVQSGSSCKMHTNSGSITTAFPKNASLSLSAVLQLGSISSDFSSIAINGKSAHGTIGHAPFAHVNLEAQIGSIGIHKF